MSDPCKPEACAIQNCLISSDYKESKCQDLVDQLYRCCDKFYKEDGKENKSPCCPKPDLLALKMKQRGL
ncbi:Cmc4p TDEL_0A06980 [Torulaspora delbrueckii]|uniref:Cx9C motif-containing protein 4, mitochondrial n=1 Tax=Torulaspora delbrueckii TaxID=4950 RepID=G8ZN36_TORDE|nr:hypothetical protein TDEL_0A06980 [Torulaspora delbrueckii]CCE90030.1 hypothetical protein TDEL_0A06980 [Torulaspora delbrueckii]